MFRIYDNVLPQRTHFVMLSRRIQKILEGDWVDPQNQGLSCISQVRCLCWMTNLNNDTQKALNIRCDRNPKTSMSAYSVFGTTVLCVAHCTLLRSKAHPRASSKSSNFYVTWQSWCPAAYLWCCHHCHRWDLQRQTCIHDNTKYWKLKVKVNLFAFSMFPASDLRIIPLCWKVLEGPWARLCSLNSLWVVCETQPSCVDVRIDAHT